MSPIKTNGITLRLLLAYVAVATIATLFVIYVLFQARFLIAGPQIELYTTNQVVQSDRVVLLEGRVNNIVHLTLNGRAIYTDESGYFKETIVLENGYTVATLRAKDRYGRVTTRERSFVYTNTDLSDNL